MTKANEYSLWLMPIGDVYRRLANLISRLGERYSSPSFEPHVTLIGKLLGSEEDMLSRTSRLAGLLRPYTIRLERVGYLDEYFRCLFIRVRETKDVMEANLKAGEVFGVSKGPGYMPHLSLMYGDFAPGVKEEIIAKVGRGFDMGFEAKSIHLFSTNGEPKGWHRVKEFALK